MAAVSKDYIKQGEYHDRAYWQAQITECLRDFFYSTYNAETVEEIIKLPANCFSAGLEYARTQCVKRGDLLDFTEHKLKGRVYNETYNPQAVEELACAFISICNLFNKAPSLFSFAILSGIDRSVLHSWARDGVSSSHRHNNTKTIIGLKEAREASLSNMVISGGKNTLGVIATMNHEVWNNSGVAEEKQRTISLSELPDLQYIKFEIEDKTGSDVSASVPVSAGDAVGDLAGLPVLGVNTDI